MRGTKAKTFCLLGALFLAGSLTARAQDDQESLEDLFYTYSNDNIVTDYYDDVCLLETNELEQKSYSGFLALKQTDLNWDGTDELLAIRLKPQENAEERTVNALIAEAYHRQDNTLQRMAQYTLAEGILDQTESYIEVFMVNAQSGILIGCEARDKETLLADGLDWQLTGIGFDGAGFYKVTGASLSGSAFTQEQLAYASSAAGDLGMDPWNVVEQPLDEQTEAMDMLCTVDRYFVTDRDTLNSFLYNGGNEAGFVSCSETWFKDYANPGRENKISGEFAGGGSAPQEAAPDEWTDAESYYFEGNYVIPDSDSRYITEDDLRRLSADEILLARNEIYARHGRIFNNEALNAYFMSKSWYEPSVSGSEFTEEYAASVFNEYEISNIAVMLEYERAHGLNDLG